MNAEGVDCGFACPLLGSRGRRQRKEYSSSVARMSASGHSEREDFRNRPDFHRAASAHI